MNKPSNQDPRVDLLSVISNHKSNAPAGGGGGGGLDDCAPQSSAVNCHVSTALLAAKIRELVGAPQQQQNKLNSAVGNEEV